MELASRPSLARNAEQNVERSNIALIVQQKSVAKLAPHGGTAERYVLTGEASKAAATLHGKTFAMIEQAAPSAVFVSRPTAILSATTRAARSCRSTAAQTDRQT